ncbi:MAG: hypothetical protein Q9228_002721 [Teloschistes exilis]
MSQLLSQIGCASEYTELPAKNHWFEGVMTTQNLLRFYDNILENRLARKPIPSTFEFVVVNPGIMGSKYGIVVDQLTSPERPGMLSGNFDPEESSLHLHTSNVHRLHFLPTIPVEWLGSNIIVDGSRIQLLRDVPNLSQWLLRLTNGSWMVSNEIDWSKEQRHGRQVGGIDALLNTGGTFIIRTPVESLSLATQVSRNLFQYFGADTEIVALADPPKSHEGIEIQLFLGNAYWSSPTAHAPPIYVDRHIGLVIQHANGHCTSYGFSQGLGAIFLWPSPVDNLNLMVWGSDLPGLRSAVRLVPMLASVGQPDFVIVSRECAWKGIGGVRALGHFNSFWNISKCKNIESTESTSQIGSMNEAMLHLKMNDDGEKTKYAMIKSDGPSPLLTSKLENVQAPASNRSAGVKGKIKYENSDSDLQENLVDALLAKLTEQQQEFPKNAVEEGPGAMKATSSGNSQKPSTESSSSTTILTPTMDASGNAEVPTTKEGETVSVGKAEMLRLKKELIAAKKQLEMQKQELERNRVINHTFDQALGPSVEDVGISKGVGGPKSRAKLQHAASVVTSRYGQTQSDVDAHSDNWEIPSTANFNNVSQNSNWPTGQSQPRLNYSPVNPQYQQPMTIWGPPGTNPALAPRQWNPKAVHQGLPSAPMFHQPSGSQQRIFSGPPSPGTIGDGRYVNDFNQYQTGFGLQRTHVGIPRNDPMGAQQRGSPNGWPLLGNGIGGLEAMNVGVGPNHAQGMYQPSMPYQPRPIGTPLSPTAAEFRTDQAHANPWNTTASTSPGQVYVQPMEPLNYRRLLDRSVSCNWKYIVDKIVCNNDQQASIFLQQKLKVGTVEQKYEIVEAIVAQAYPLMVNRFGNFLVQRCFEHGTPEQVVAIANAIRGNTLSLSMDAFGCHVVQKAFDAVPEEYKAIMVHELLRRIPETVIHRYACHVWQKLFELRWADSPPQIMKYVNEALRGMWHDVALGETGSLVVQNIFENCLEEDKRPCINEVLNNIDIVAHGQFGNWCIQHICEHGAPQDRSRAIDHVLRYATEYSMDQFASKVVEKCLKIGGSDFLERYLERVCEGRQDRPRIPLIDIASDQYGNYLIQYILTHANNTHREIVASNVRKHMVSLRGSKFGSRVGMLCCNPAYATHPGPGVGMSSTRYSSAPAQGPRFGGAYPIASYYPVSPSEAVILLELYVAEDQLLSRISLISKRDIRYVGTLHEINSENSTVALENVVSWGTEGRDPENEVPPSDTVYEYIVFRGSDVKDLRIEEPPKENQPPKPPQVPDDPAILGSARRPAAAEIVQKHQPESPASFSQPQREQGQQSFQPQQHQQQPPRFPQHSPYPPYFNPYGPPPPNQRFGPQGFPQGQGFPGMPYGAPPPGWYPPPGQGFPNQGYGQFPPPQMPIGSGHQQNQSRPAPAAMQEQQTQQPQLEPEKPVATVKLPSASNTPALPEASLSGPPPPTESKPDVAAALAPPARTETKDPPTTEKNVQASQKNGRLVPAVPITRVSPAVKPAVPINGTVQSNGANAPKPEAPAKPTETRPTQVATKSIEEANRDARAAVAAAMAKLPPAPNGQQATKKTPAANATKTDNNQNGSTAMDNLTNKVNEMRTNDNIRTSRQPGTGGYAAGYRGGRGNSYRGGRSRNDSQSKKVEVPTTDYDFELANAKFNKQDLVKEAILSGSPLGSPTVDGANDMPPTPAVNGERKASEASVSITPAVGYNKTTSFFDNISSESKEREEGAVKKGGREFRSEEVKKNLETFGQGSVDGGRGGYRGRGRGRGGFGGRGRGYGGRGRGVRGGRADMVTES